jgi:hypothetical protein
MELPEGANAKPPKANFYIPFGGASFFHYSKLAIQLLIFNMSGFFMYSLKGYVLRSTSIQ